MDRGERVGREIPPQSSGTSGAGLVGEREDVAGRSLPRSRWLSEAMCTVRLAGSLPEPFGIIPARIAARSSARALGPEQSAG